MYTPLPKALALQLLEFRALPILLALGGGQFCPFFGVGRHEVLHASEPLFKASVGLAQRLLGIHVHMPRELGQAEKHIAKFRLNRRAIAGRERGFQLANLLVDLWPAVSG